MVRDSVAFWLQKSLIKKKEKHECNQKLAMQKLLIKK